MSFRRSAIAVALVALVGAAVAVGAGARTQGTITGAGATFPQPLIAVWQQQYKRDQINYNGIGSGGGIAAITNRTVDFGASDAPLTPDQFAACKSCVQIPWVLSATAVMYNLDGVKNALHMNGRLIADIYLGRVTHWNDGRIKRLNPGVSLPDKKITPVYRSDGSGTTYNFTDYLTAVSPTFKGKVGGPSTTVNWPTGVGARGSSGVAGVVTRTEGAVGYADDLRVAMLTLQRRELHAPSQSRTRGTRTRAPETGSSDRPVESARVRRGRRSGSRWRPTGPPRRA